MASHPLEQSANLLNIQIKTEVIFYCFEEQWDTEVGIHCLVGYFRFKMQWVLESSNSPNKGKKANVYNQNNLF